MSKPRPPQRDDFAHFLPMPTRWADNDAYGHVNNVQYYAFFDTAVNALLVERGLLDVTNSPVIGLVVETACTYFASVKFPDALEVGIAIERIGSSSLTYRLAIFRQGEAEAAALGRFVHVYVDRQSQRPVPLSPAIRRHAETLVVN